MTRASHKTWPWGLGQGQWVRKGPLPREQSTQKAGALGSLQGGPPGCASALPLAGWESGGDLVSALFSSSSTWGRRRLLDGLLRGVTERHGKPLAPAVASATSPFLCKACGRCGGVAGIQKQSIYGPRDQGECTA